MPRTGVAVNLDEKAAEFPIVCPSTLRDRDRAGKSNPMRHPMNHYRLYRRDELEADLRFVREVRQDG